MLTIGRYWGRLQWGMVRVVPGVGIMMARRELVVTMWWGMVLLMMMMMVVMMCVVVVVIVVDISVRELGVVDVIF